MSWDADLIAVADGNPILVAEWNYTHNCNGMIAVALYGVLGCVNALSLDSDSPLDKAIGPSWWKRLDGCDGQVGGEFLRDLVGALESDPDRFRALNPPNGWGDYDSLLVVLREMRDASLKYPTTGKWEVGG